MSPLVSTVGLAEFPRFKLSKGAQTNLEILGFTLPLGFKFQPDIGPRMVHMDVAAGVDNCHQMVHTVVPSAQISRLSSVP